MSALRKQLSRLARASSTTFLLPSNRRVLTRFVCVSESLYAVAAYCILNIKIQTTSHFLWLNYILNVVLLYLDVETIQALLERPGCLAGPRLHHPHDVQHVNSQPTATRFPMATRTQSQIGSVESTLDSVRY
jgi:hypothetical protein